MKVSKEMYNRMKKITNQIKSLDGDKWGDCEIVDKLLTAYMARMSLHLA